MKDRHGIHDIRIGDQIETDKRPYTVLILDILEATGEVVFIDNEGVKGFGKPGHYMPKFTVTTKGAEE